MELELEAPNDANSKLQEVMDIMMTEKRSEQTEKIEHVRGHPDVIKQMLMGHPDVSSLQPFGWPGHRLVRPQERWLEPLAETDGDETMDNPGADEAGETSAVRSKIPIGSRDCYPRSMSSLSVSRLVPRLCWWYWATTA